MALTFEENGNVWCEIVFSDTGHGIADEHLEKIFDPFFTTKLGGTGLGLAIVYRIIEDHGGTITVETDKGKNAKFIIRIPIVEDEHYNRIADERTKNRFASL